MSRYSDRFMAGEEWQGFLAMVEQGTPAEELRETYHLSRRNMIRSVRRAQKQLGIDYTIPPEEASSRSCRARDRSPILDDPDISPVRRIVLANDWNYLSPLEKAFRLMPGRIGQMRNGSYTLDGRPVNYRDILVACNHILAIEGLEQLPGPNVFVPPDEADRQLAERLLPELLQMAGSDGDGEDDPGNDGTRIKIRSDLGSLHSTGSQFP